jgi:hypothetical protein
LTFSLRFEILEQFAYKGKLSKSMVEKILEEHRRITKTKKCVKHHRPEILEDFQFFETEGLIKKINTNPGPGLAHGRGRPKTYYTITEKGLKALLTHEDFDPPRFWKILYGYCQNSDSIIKLDKFEECYQILITRRLKYPAHGFSFQLDIFDRCNKWFQETIVKSNDITPLQKVIEILASHPRITFEKLVEETHEPKERVKEILLSHSHTSKLYEESWRWEKINQTYTDFIIQNIITERSANDAEPTYELSLFGVMLCLVMIRYDDMGRLRGRLYCKYSFERYYDRIASKYTEKLPLIFGKRNQLKEILKVFTYYNLDIIFNRKIRSNNKNSRSVRKGGNKELIEGISQIILDNKDSISDFADAGWKVLENYMYRYREDVNEPSLDRVFWLCDKLNELLMLLHPSPLVYTFMTMSTKRYLPRDIRSTLTRMEESFADEIAAFYYMNLCTDSNIRVSESRLLDKTPRQCLLLILEQDKEKPLIKEWFLKWIEDLKSQQSDLSDEEQKLLDNFKAIV